MNEMYELIALIAMLIAIVVPIPLVVFIVLSFQRRGAIMTNAEHIRNMSDEKLAAWLWNHIDRDAFCGEMCADKQPHTWCWKSPSVEKCADKMLEWLRQEHKE